MSKYAEIEGGSVWERTSFPVWASGFKDPAWEKIVVSKYINPTVVEVASMMGSHTYFRVSTLLEYWQRI